MMMLLHSQSVVPLHQAITRLRKTNVTLTPSLLKLTINSTGLTNLKGYKDLKEFVASLEKPR